MSHHIFVPTTGPEAWQQLLAEPDRQWRSGYSARTLAHCWESADGFPPEVQKAFVCSGLPEFGQLELLLAFPEHKVYMPPMNSHPSQNDLFVLARDGKRELVSIMVEGKVSESFDRTVGEWNPSETRGKTLRFEFLQNLLGLQEIPSHIRYQLLHRSASAILEAQRFNAASAIMLVHSFSPTAAWLEDYQAFAALFGVHAEEGILHFVKEVGNIRFFLAWVKGSPEFLGK